MLESPCYRSEYVTIEDLSIHFLDGGMPDGYPLMLLHGVPLWSYTYRNLIPILIHSGYRVICPDLIGFGLSTHFRKGREYSFSLQMKVLEKLIDYLGFSELIIYGQDWGAAFALDLAARHSKMIQGCVVSNGLVPPEGEKLPASLKLWTLFTRYAPIIPMSLIMKKGCDRKLSKEEIRAFQKPFIQSGTKSGIRAYPQWIRKPSWSGIFFGDIWHHLKNLESPVLCIFSENDNFTKGGFDYLIANIPGCRGQSHLLLPGGHFIQEDQPDLLAQAIAGFAQDIQTN